MSIRVTSSGHNFSAHTPSTATDTTIVIESSKAMLVPTSLLDDVNTIDHLQSAGIAMDVTTEDAIIVKDDTITSAIIVLPKSLHELIYNTYGGGGKYTTPLLAKAPSAGHDILVHLSSDQTLLCINVFNGRDRIFAELFEIGNITDVLYWISRLGEGFDLSTYDIYVDRGDKELEKLLKNFTKALIIYANNQRTI
ncbi:MAG: hypothetical protein SNG27_06520 [Rikenellaceae bacterium]